MQPTMRSAPPARSLEFSSPAFSNAQNRGIRIAIPKGLDDPEFFFDLAVVALRTGPPGRLADPREQAPWAWAAEMPLW